MFPLIALILSGAPAQAEQGDLAVGFGAGWYFSPAETFNESNLALVPRLRYDITDPIGLEVDIGFARGLNQDLDVAYRGFLPRLNFVYNHWYDSEIQLVGVAGLGFMSKTVLDVNDDDQELKGLLLNVGPQFRVPLTEYAAMRFDGRYVADFSGTADDLEQMVHGIELTAGFEGVIGLVDKDADDDGFTDDIDECVNEAEDFDDFEDADGCPEVDNDMDGVLDADDDCPLELEDLDEFEDTDGCPDPDNDQDGLADVDDTCPVEAGPEATGGCPDKDGDLVPDSRDRCPEKARNPKIAPEKSNGCPAQRVALGAKKIEIYDKVFFETGSAKIKEESNTLLDEIAEVLTENARIKKVQVEGHTDNVGNARFNTKLSEQRAQSVVDYLVGAGVEEERLVAKGFGPEKPIADNDTDEGKAENRRVEFNIVEQGKVRTDRERSDTETETDESQGVEYVEEPEGTEGTEESGDSGRERSGDDE